MASCTGLQFVNPLCHAENAASAVVGDAIENMATAVMEAFGKTVASLGTVWMYIGTPNLTGGGSSTISAGSSAENSEYIERGIRRELERRLHGSKASYLVNIEGDEQLKKTLDLFERGKTVKDLYAVKADDLHPVPTETIKKMLVPANTTASARSGDHADPQAKQADRAAPQPKKEH